MSAKLILTAFIVHAVLSSSNEGQAMVISNTDPGTFENAGVQQNFQKLINSVAESDSRRSNIYRNVLKQDVTNGREAFDAMKGEVQSQRSRNADRRKNHVGSEFDHSGNGLLAKREVNYYELAKPGGNCSLASEEYVKMYGTHYNDSGVWPRANELAEDDPALKHICWQAHIQLWPHQDLMVMWDAIVETKILKFTGTNHPDIKADVLFCDYKPQPTYVVYTKGLRPDCVFMCHKWGNRHPRYFELADHVCNIEM